MPSLRLRGLRIALSPVLALTGDPGTVVFAARPKTTLLPNAAMLAGTVSTSVGLLLFVQSI